MSSMLMDFCFVGVVFGFSAMDQRLVVSAMRGYIT